MWNRNSKTVTVVSILFILIIRSYPFWYRIEGGSYTLVYYLLVFVLFMTLVIQFFHQFVRLIKGWQKSLKSSLLSILIISVALFDGIFNPLNVDLEFLYGDIVFRACREGTQNQATMRLRENGHFDIHWTGVFFADSYYSYFVKLQNFVYDSVEFGNGILRVAECRDR